MASVVTDLQSCFLANRLGSSLSFASAALFIFEYSITFFDELRFIWFRRVSVSTVLFFLARYGGMASTILTLVQTPTTTLLLANMSTALRVVVIVASEAILAVRTWAIWEKKMSVLIFLCLVSVAALGGNMTMVLRGVHDTHVEHPEFGCIVVVASKSHPYLYSYLVVIAYECITIFLSGIRIFKWRRQIAPSAQTPLLDTLWNDGLLYFSWMIAVGIVNILLIFHASAAVQTGGAQLQSSIHSILSSRIVLHLAKLPGSRPRQNRTSTYVSSLFTPTTVQLESELSAETNFPYFDLG
ncbi:hypothetical protein DFH09DRAFT_1193972 [Mycena vulgaris]|nr:hypothetical protein DFH09DRAFT_1193972 [Mycena vulgaris]